VPLGVAGKVGIATNGLAAFSNSLQPKGLLHERFSVGELPPVPRSRHVLKNPLPIGRDQARFGGMNTSTSRVEKQHDLRRVPIVGRSLGVELESATLRPLRVGRERDHAAGEQVLSPCFARRPFQVGAGLPCHQ